MPLSPAPLLPGQSPLSAPGERPADRRALRMGALVGLFTLALALVPGQLLLPRLLYLTPGLLARAEVGGQGGQSSAGSFQGFAFMWTARSSGAGGYTTPASAKNMRSEAHDFHMNTVVIPVVADMPYRSESTLYWQAGGKYQYTDTLPDADYVQAIADARAAGLMPILELEVRQQDTYNAPYEYPYFIGHDWYDEAAGQDITTATGNTATVGQLEWGWVDNYTAFAVHFAALAQTQHMPYLIVGDDLADMTVDGSASTKQGDPHGVAHSKAVGDTFTCSGRHECEWRHIVAAVRGRAYANYLSRGAKAGGNYQGKVIYAASGLTGDQYKSSPQGEFELIKWWNAVDAIGVDAYFPLTQNSADPSVGTLINAWHGQGAGLGGQGNIYARLQAVQDQYQKPVVFTAAGYESTQGSNASPGRTEALSYDPDEQKNDMMALLQTFSGTSWWDGVIWWADEPLSPRSAQPNWQRGTLWAGDNLHGTKPTDAKSAGLWLSTYYHSAPVPCLC